MNTNTSSGFRDLAAQTVTVLTPVALQWTNNSTPVLATGSNLSLVTDQDLLTGGTFDNSAFRVRLAGVANVAATASTVTVGIYVGSVATGTLLKTVVSQSLTAAKTNFFLETELLWDSVSQALSGLAWGAAGFGGTVANGALANNPPAIVNAAGLTFSAAVTFSVANAANTIQVNEFSIEIV